LLGRVLRGQVLVLAHLARRGDLLLGLLVEVVVVVRLLRERALAGRGAAAAGAAALVGVGAGLLPGIRLVTGGAGGLVSLFRLLVVRLALLVTTGGNRGRVERARDDLAETQLGGLAERLGLLRVARSGHGDDDVVAVQHHLGTADAEAVHTLVDDRSRRVQRLPRRVRAVRGTRGQHDAGATLQVDAQLRHRLAVAGEEHQAVQDDADQQEYR